MKINGPEVVVLGGSFGGRGGVETHVARWCIEFARRGLKITLVVSVPPQARSRLAGLADAGIHCVNLGTGNPMVRLARATLVALGLRRNHVVFYSNGTGRLAPWLGRILRPSVWVHQHHINYASGDFKRWSKAEQKMICRVDHVIVCSAVHARRMAADLGISTVAGVPYLKAEGETLAPPNSSPATIVYMGLLRKSKGVPLLLSLAPWFRQNGCRLVLWGRDAEGLLNGRLPDGVEWRGEYDPDRDLNRILAEANCLALPFKEGEGLPIVISEALSRGVPVATFGFSGIDWLRDLHPGLAVVEGDGADLTREIQRLVRSGAETDFRQSLRQAYIRRLGNDRCLEWWQNLGSIYGH